MLRREDAVLVVIDVQEKLLPHIHEADRLVEQIALLVEGVRLVDAPIMVTEQYRKGLGPTDPRVIDALGRTLPEATFAEPRAFAPLEKMTFGCGADPAFLEALRSTKRKQVLVAGMETHVCVLQTALQLREAGFEVYVTADAVSSRSPRNVELALRRMEQEGVRVTSVEMAVFEMLHVCGTPEFKAWSRRIR